MPPRSGTRSIGQVLKVLKEEFPDISISKIRFLESEGLVAPERAPSGYRRYAEADIARLRYILQVQKQQYLPLKVIREHLEKMDAGEAESEHPAPEPAPVIEPLVVPPPVQPRPMGKRAINVTRRELLQISGLSEPQLAELERHQLVVPRHGSLYYGRDALTVAVATRKLAAYGMDARHLRAIRQAAQREASLVDQAASAHGRRRQQSRQTAADVMQLVLYAHAALLRQSLTS